MVTTKLPIYITQRLFTWCRISTVIFLTSGPCKLIMELFINRTISAFLFFVFFTPSVTHCAIVYVYHAHAENLAPYVC